MNKPMRPLSPIEVAAGFAVVGSLLAVMTPSFIKNLHASSMTEAVDGLQQISARATALAEAAPQHEAYPPSAPLTPESVPRASLAVDPPGTWAHPTWRLLAFELTGPHAYSFQFDSQNGPQRSTFTAEARGDLDGDGVLSSFRISGSVEPGRPPQRDVLEVVREVE